MLYNKIAVISDIHSNVYALNAVLKDIETRDIDITVNLGDSLFGPIDPIGTAQRLMDHDQMIHIMGNCDEELLQDHSDSLTYQFVKPLLDSELLRWVHSYKSTWKYEDILFCHGTPGSNRTYLLEQATESGIIYKSAELLSDELRSIQEQYIICGHSHVSRTQFLTDDKIVINAGSVGLPAYEDDLPVPHVMESGSPHAKYVILTRNDRGSWDIAHLQIAYDWERAADIANQNGRNDYAYAIMTGRALVKG